MVDAWETAEVNRVVAGRRLELAIALSHASGESKATAWRARAVWAAAAVSAAATWLVTR